MIEAAYFRLISNPLSWLVAVATLVYLGSILAYDLYVNK